MSEMYDITRLIDGVVEVVDISTAGAAPLTGSPSIFSRFVVHLRYFAQRLFQDKLMPDTDAPEDLSFREIIVQNCPTHYKCALCIAEYVKNTWHKELSQEELLYLTIHLKRWPGACTPGSDPVPRFSRSKSKG